MGFSQDQIKALEADLAKDSVKERSQAGRKLSYIEGWHAIAEANRIFGHDGWDRETHLHELGEPSLGHDRDGKEQWRVRYMARVTVTVRAGSNHIVRDGIGYGSGIAKDLGDAYEGAIKEAETDATKRALMTFGWPFGLALYDKSQEHVETGNGKAKAGGTPPKAQTQAKAPSKADSRETYERLSKANRAKENIEDFNKFWKTPSVLDALAGMPDDWRRNMEAERDDKAVELEERAAMANDFPGDLSAAANLMSAG